MGSNSIMVFTVYTGASAQDIENNITKPLENTLNSVSNLKHLTSRSRENYSIVFLEFEYGIDIEDATNDVRDKLDMVKSSLPDESNDPFLFKFSAEDVPILFLSVQATESVNALYKILDDKVVSPLSRVGGVGTVSISGAPQREIQVYCDPQKLEAYNLSIESIAAVIGAENRNVPLGNIDLGSETYSMRVVGEFDNAYDLNNIVVGSFNNKDIYLRDVGEVRDHLQERMQEVYNNGVKGAMIIVQKQTGANSVSISQKVKSLLPSIQKSLPTDVKLGVINDTSDSILNTIDSLEEAIMITLILVIFVVLFFLGRWRATFIVAIVIPISLVASFIYLKITGNSLNIISLSSLSLAIGMVVDDAIVVLENISTHIERGTKPKSAAVYATSEVSISIIASTLVIFAVFVPLTMITGMSGVLFRQLGWMVTIVIFVSLMASMTLTPMLSSLLLKNNPNRGKVFGYIYAPVERGLNNLSQWYSRALQWALHHRIIVMLSAMGIFIGSLFLFKVIPTEFFPTQDNAAIQMTVKLPIGTRVETSRQFGLDLTQTLMKNYPEILTCNFSVGQPDDNNTFGMLSTNGTHILSYNIRFTRKTERERSLSQLMDAIRYDLSKYPEINTYDVKTGMGGGMGSNNVNIEIYGYDFDTADKLAAEIKNKMLKVPGCPQVTISREEYIPEIQIDFDREKLAEHGLNLTTVSTYVRNRFNGAIASYYREDGEEYYIKVRYAPEFRESIESIENILVYNAQGTALRVRDLGKVVERMTPPTIERKDRERIVTVSCMIAANAALSDVVDGANKVMNEIEIPAGMSYDIGGTYEDQQESFSDLIMLMILIALLVYIVMASQFESFTYPFIIMFAILFALTGVLIGLAITKTALGVMALVGILMLIGIVVKNGIVLIDYTILCRERGMNVFEAVATAGRSRLRPILMTTSTTVLGMIPLAIGKGEGAEMWNSLGMTVAFGLSVSTIVTLVIVPVLYSLFADFGIWRKKRKKLHSAMAIEKH
jgi:HAE1 family hydrophobic/amphiphilic exporter-1